jgi:triphosphatase
MAQEIELKFIVAQDGVDALRQHLNALEAKHTPAGQLLNIYYETADNWLRRHDMGLRIRGDQGRYEMTLKIAGRVVGGLHQRPEYNIPLEAGAGAGAPAGRGLAAGRTAGGAGAERTAAVQHRFCA